MINIAPWLQTHAPHLYAALPTIGILLGVWAALATALIKQVPKPKPPAPEWKLVLYQIFLNYPAMLPGLGLKGFLGLPLSIPFLHLSSDPQPAAPAIQLPPVIRPGMLLPFLLLGALAVSGCAGLKAWGKCELNFLPQTLEAALVDGVMIAMDTSKTAQDLLDFAHQVAPGQEDCFLAAIEGSKTPAATKAHAARAVHRAKGGHACACVPVA